MDDDTEICGRDREVKEIRNYISGRIESKKPGILYLTGPPGTGKSMSIRYVLNQINQVIPRLYINCLKVQTPKSILSKICHLAGLDKFSGYSESEIIARLTRKFSSRTCNTLIIILDEMDKLPKSKNADLIKTIFSWPNLTGSKLILVGIANTVNLTSTYQTISFITGKDGKHITKVLFKSYTSKDIRAILQWYLDNDENFEDSIVDSKALDMIAAKFARESGDIRGALNALKSAIDDTVKNQFRSRTLNQEIEQFPTPPSTPPLSPRKDKTNIASLANSIKKRQRATNHLDDLFPFPHQVMLTCLYKLSSGSKDSMVDSKVFKDLVNIVLDKYGVSSSLDDYRAIMDSLQMQGLVALKRGKIREKIILKASESELANLLQRKDMIMDLINNLV